MPINQFYLAIVPEEGLLRIHNEIPAQIAVSRETGYLESEMNKYWDVVEADVIEIVQDLDKIVMRGSWGDGEFHYGWKTQTDKVDNDASMFISKISNKVEEFSFRADLREDKLEFLKNMIELGEKYNWLFMDRKGNIISPNLSEIGNVIQESDSFEFLKESLKCLVSKKLNVK